MKPKCILIRVRRLIALAPLAAWAGLCTVNAETGAAPDARLVNALDKVIQSRFQEIDGRSFGISRIGPQHVRKFEATTGAERTAVADLESAGWEVRLYVPSRAQLSASRKDNSKFQWSVGRDVIIVGYESSKAHLPRTAVLWENASKALALFETKSEHAFKADQYHIIARPVRASKQACLDCHNRGGKTLKVDDTLGVALYAFAKKS